LVTAKPSELITNPEPSDRREDAPPLPLEPSGTELTLTTPGLTAFTSGASEVGGTKPASTGALPVRSRHNWAPEGIPGCFSRNV
jgi:hypothetical protein